MIKPQNNNAWASITVLVLLTITFMAYYFIIPVHGKIYDIVLNDSKYSGYVTESDCNRNGGIWEDSECKPLPNRARTVINHNRNAWLLAPIIFAIGLIIWLFTVSTRRDPKEYYQR